MIQINYEKPTVFGHHRDGWAAATRELQKIHNPYGVKLYDWADRVFKDNVTIDHPWCGFLHNVLSYPKEYPQKYTGRIYPISQLVQKKFFQQSLKKCEGLYTLSKHVAGFLERTTDTRVVSFTHPTAKADKLFDCEAYQQFDKKVVTIGQWLRKYHSIYHLETTHKKMMLRIDAFCLDYKEMQNYTSGKNDVTILPYLSNQEYDNLLSNCVVFLDLYDCSACNVVLECIARTTPILINILPGTVEHLGPNYPLYYENLEEASQKLQDETIVLKAHNYIKNMDKTKIDPAHFLNDFMSRT